MAALAPKSCPLARQCWIKRQVRRERATHREGARSVARDRPTPAPVQRCSLLNEDTNGPTAAKCVRIDLALDLERVEWEENYLADTRQAAGGRLYHHLSLPFAECVRVTRLVVSRKHVIEPWLTTKLVDPL